LGEVYQISNAGVYQFTGAGDTEEDIRKAVALTKEVKGVKSVKNDMRVRGR